MKLYIDPGTGSMLFAILIGMFSALIWLMKGWIVKLRFFLSGGKKQDETEQKLPIAIFADDKRYWQIFEPVIKELDQRGIDVCYMTASSDDPGLNNPYVYVQAQFIGEGNKAFAKLNFLNAVILLATTPGLDVYQWKRSKEVDYYVHMLHMANDPTLYRMFGLDYYDAVLLSGEYQIRQIRQLEEQRNLPEKELLTVGIPYMDEMKKRLETAPVMSYSDVKTVLVAPSWGKSALFGRYEGRILEELLKTDYHIIIRPHPQSFTSEKEMIERLMETYPDSDRIEWNRDNDNFDCLNRADILISDFSGVVFDFALVYDKPVIYADTLFDDAPYDAWWLSEEPWTFTALPRLGEALTEEKLPQIGVIIEKCLTDEQYREKRQKVREETWVYPGEGAVRIADYLIEKYNTLKEKTQLQEKGEEA